MGQKEVIVLKPSGLFLFDGLNQNEMDVCIRHVGNQYQRYRKGQVIYDPQCAQPALAYMLEGHARVMQGRVAMNDLFAGDTFGAAALFGSGDPFPTTVVAVTDCCLWLIPQEIVCRWMAEVPRVAENYIRFLSDRIRFLNQRIITLTAGTGDDRLWQYLRSHQDADGVVSSIGGMTALAERLDMGRSSLYRSLDALAAEGRIRKEGKKIIICKTEG